MSGYGAAPPDRRNDRRPLAGHSVLDRKFIASAALLPLAGPMSSSMIWTGKQKGEGFEFHLLAVAILIVLMARGAGAASVGCALAKN